MGRRLPHIECRRDERETLVLEEHPQGMQVGGRLRDVPQKWRAATWMFGRASAKVENSVRSAMRERRCWPEMRSV